MQKYSNQYTIVWKVWQYRVGPLFFVMHKMLVEGRYLG